MRFLCWLYDRYRTILYGRSGKILMRARCFQKDETIRILQESLPNELFLEEMMIVDLRGFAT